MTDLPIAGELYAFTYRTRIGGILTDLPTGGGVDQLVLKQSGSTILTVAGPATHSSTGTYTFPPATMPVAGDYDVEVTYRTAASPTKLDVGETLRVYAFSGDITGQTELYALQDLADFMQTPVDAETGTLIRRLVTSLIKAEGLDYSSPGSTVPDEVLTVALTASARAYGNPQGIRGETVGPYTIQRDPNAGVYLTDAERAALASVLATGSTTHVPLGVGSIGLVPALAGNPRALPSIRTPWPGTLGHPEQ